MRQRIKQAVDAEVLVFWRAQFALVGEKLAQNPLSESAWFWRVQWDILNYLLHRYGGDEKRAAMPSSEQIAFARVAGGTGPAKLELKPSGSFASFAGMGKQPRASGNLRPFLENIVRANQERHKTLQRLREEMAQARQEQRKLNREWTEWVKEFYAIYGLLEGEFEAPEPASDELSDDEIVEMLSKMLEIDDPAGGPGNS